MSDPAQHKEGRMPDPKDQSQERVLRSYDIDANTVRVNTPGRDDPDLIVRRLKSGKTKVYEAQKRKAKS